MRQIGDARRGEKASASRKKQHGKVYSSPNLPYSQVGHSEEAEEILRWLDWGEAPWRAFRPDGDKEA